LLVGCLLRTVSGKHAEAVQSIVDVFGDEGVKLHLAATFSSVWQRPLAFHLGQAALSYRCFREIGELLGEPSATACLRATPGAIEAGRR
jgi:hypothetical protein